MKNLFIDTNVFLSFYEFTNDDLVELEKLLEYIDAEDIRLYLPEQVKNEFLSNRERVIDRSIKKLKESRMNIQFPQMCMVYPEYEVLKNSVKEYRNAHKPLIDSLEADIAQNQLRADILIDKVFDAAYGIDLTDEILNRTRRRIHLGYPPGKLSKLGDAVIWQSLLDTVPEGEDLYLVSNDSDFQSLLKKGQLHPFLDKDWTESKSSILYFYSVLSDAFKDLSIQIVLSEMQSKSNAVDEFINSPSFHSTHIAVRELERFSQALTRWELNLILEAIVSNSQIRLIFIDEDIQQFFWNMVDGRLDDIYQGTLVKLQDWLRDNYGSLRSIQLTMLEKDKYQELLRLDPTRAPVRSEYDDIPF